MLIHQIENKTFDKYLLNQTNFEETLPENIKNHLDIHPVQWIDEVLTLALASQPVALPEANEIIANDVQLTDKAVENKASVAEGIKH